LSLVLLDTNQASSEQRTANSEQQTANSKQRTANSKQRTANTKQTKQTKENDRDQLRPSKRDHLY
jgi:hypothetical protein